MLCYALKLSGGGMEAKQHISRVKSMQHAGLCIETRTTIKQLNDNTQWYREEKGNNGSHNHSH